MPGIWADRLSRYHETPARICAQGSHHAFQGSTGAPEALPSEKADPALALLCPVRALHIYVDCMQSFRTSKQLFICYGGQQNEKAVSKQRLAHWIVDAIILAYQTQGVPCPLRLRAHSTRNVSSSWALVQGI